MASNPPDKNNFLYPKVPYRGEVKPENLVFNANLQEFAYKVMYVCNLETAGKISTEQAYQQIKDLWKTLKKSRKALQIDNHPPEEEQP